MAKKKVHAKAKSRSKSKSMGKAIEKPLVKAKSKAKRKSKKGGFKKLFAMTKSKPEKNFSSKFEYGNLAFNINSTIKSGIVKCNVKVESKNFGFNGVITLNEKSFFELRYMMDHLLSNARKIG